MSSRALKSLPLCDFLHHPVGKSKVREKMVARRTATRIVEFNTIHQKNPCLAEEHKVTCAVPIALRALWQQHLVRRMANGVSCPYSEEQKKGQADQRGRAQAGSGYGEAGSVGGSDVRGQDGLKKQNLKGWIIRQRDRRGEGQG